MMLTDEEKLDIRFAGLWSGCSDLNRGPHAPKARALAELRYTPAVQGLIYEKNRFQSSRFAIQCRSNTTGYVKGA